MELIDTELFSIQKRYTLYFEERGKEIEVGVETDYQENQNYEEITNIEFLTECSEKQEAKIKEIIEDGEWKQ